ncbi:MAG: CDC27 family protein [Pirellulales bacterium]|nr:CDC27 family protein [Pirellulales bacterium]
MHYCDRKLLLVWPGLAHLWIRGSWAGLVLAVGFSLLVSVLFASTCVWTAWLSSTVQSAGMVLAIAIWIGSSVVAYRAGLFSELEAASGDPTRPATGDPSLSADHWKTIPTGDDLFLRAQAQYLRGDWLAAMQTLHKQLIGNRRDVEARLLLATLYRHLHRFEEANAQLAILERLEPADRWAYEIACERDRLRGSDPASNVSETESKTGMVPATTPILGVETTENSETTDRTDAA